MPESDTIHDDAQPLTVESLAEQFAACVTINQYKIVEIRLRIMATLLEQAFAEARKLAPEEQEVLAQWILDELASEERWTKAFEHSQDALAKLANEVLAEHRARRRKPLKLDKV